MFVFALRHEDEDSSLKDSTENQSNTLTTDTTSNTYQAKIITVVGIHYSARPKRGTTRN